MHVRVSENTDSTGPRTIDMMPSPERAEPLVRHLVALGVAADRLVAVGYGPDSPLADNRTSAGPAMNRRVELERMTDYCRP